MSDRDAKIIRDYEERAAECRKLARHAHPIHRDMIEHIAETWAKLAKERAKLLNPEAKRSGKKKSGDE